MNNALDLSDSLFLRLNAWFKDRFPMVNVISGALSYITMVSIGRFSAGIPVINFTLLDILGAMAFVGHLLLLRIFDEHKDFEVDKVNHPDRVLSKGLITLKHLTVIAIPLPLLSLLWTYLSFTDKSIALVLWLVMLIYSLLMAKEFFIGQWLTKRLVLYSFSHMLVSPLMILWVLVGGMGYLSFDPLIVLMLVVSFSSGISYELTRKTRGTDEDIALDAYNKQFGVTGCVSLITLFNLVSVILGYKILNMISQNQIIPIVCLFLGYLSTFYPTFNFLRKKTEKARKINEGGLGLFFLGLYISILLALFV